MLLALDTSTATVGAALHTGSGVVAARTHTDPRKHAEMLAPLLVGCLDDAGVRAQEVTRVVCGVGPGPFTGLRVGVVTAHVLAHSLGLPPPDGLCSLDAMAFQLRDRAEGPVLIATDARRKEVYWACYELSGSWAKRTSGPAVSRAAGLPASIRELPVAGRGAQLYPEALPHVIPGAGADVDPGALAELAIALTAPGHRQDAAQLLLPPEPLYLRRPDAIARPAGAGGPG